MHEALKKNTSKKLWSELLPTIDTNKSKTNGANLDAAHAERRPCVTSTERAKRPDASTLEVLHSTRAMDEVHARQSPHCLAMKEAFEAKRAILLGINLEGIFATDAPDCPQLTGLSEVLRLEPRFDQGGNRRGAAGRCWDLGLLRHLLELSNTPHGPGAAVVSSLYNAVAVSKDVFYRCLFCAHAVAKNIPACRRLFNSSTNAVEIVVRRPCLIHAMPA
mmetsp:Transcript_84251/g.212447  ORF Transcript_84251/g.212447 Transcript_84251/m.212447 type:complete len:219 (+) Transcript_84251:85-741(+)